MIVTRLENKLDIDEIVGSNWQVFDAKKQLLATSHG